MWPTALAALSMATAPTTQFLHGAGQIDHHFAEMIMILAALAVGLKWFREPDNPRAAAALAAVLGLAQAIHNGMFILQLPLLVTLFLRWTQGINAPRRPAATFAAVLLAATLAALIPSMAFRTLRFEFYTLSWFHLYIAFCTASSVLLLSFLPRSRRNVAALAGWGLLLVIPILTQIRMAQSFVAGTMKWLETISEMKSPLDAAFTSIGAQIISMMYSYLIWLLPFTLLLCIWYGWRERANPRLYFWVAAAAGLVLLTTQVRMHYFGDFALYLPWLILVDEYAKAHPPAARKTFLTTSLALVLLYVPVLRHQVIAPVSMANDPTFEDTRPLYTTLRKACAEDPGIVLADNNAGHYIRYYTDCSVLVNNFLLTPLHFSKMDEVARLFSLHARELAAAAPEVKYVLIRPLDVRRARNPQEGYKYWFFFPGMQHLAYDLLLDQSGPPPPELMMIDEVRFPEVDNIPYARLFKIRRDRAAVGTSSVGE
jgi:hypothetical protein